MHCLLEGIVHYYCRHVLKLRDDSDTSSRTKPKAYDYDFEEYNANDCPSNYQLQSKEEDHVASIHRLLQKPIDADFTLEMLKDRLFNKNLGPLRFFVQSLGISPIVLRGQVSVPAKSKAHFAELLRDWVSVLVPLMRLRVNLR
jgi:hypothetical protein